MYSNYFEMVLPFYSRETDSMFVFNTVSLHYNNDYAWYNIRSICFLDIIISTCVRKLPYTLA